MSPECRLIVVYADFYTAIYNAVRTVQPRHELKFCPLHWGLPFTENALFGILQAVWAEMGQGKCISGGGKKKWGLGLITSAIQQMPRI